MNQCKICNSTMEVKFIPKGKLYLWSYPEGIKSDWVDRQEFSLGSDYRTNRDLKYLFCTCGYSKYEEVK